MYGHPALVTDHARALAPSPRAFNRWFWKTSRHAGLFPELEKCPTGSFQAFFADPQTHIENHPEIVRCPWCGASVYEGDTDRPADYCVHSLLPSPAPGQPQDQAGGSLQVAVLLARQDSIYKSIPGCEGT